MRDGYKASAGIALLLTLSLAGCAGPPAPVDPTPVVAVAKVSKTLLFAGEEATFYASASTPATGISTHAWDFGDGAGATGPTVSHSFGFPGSYIVLVKVTTTGGTTDTTRDSPIFITVLPAPVPLQELREGSPPRARSAASAVVAEPDARIAFNGLDSFGYVRNGFYDPRAPPTPANSPYVPARGDIVDYTWRVARGGSVLATTAGALSNHTFDSPGLYTVFLTVLAGNGRTDTAAKSVLVVGKEAGMPERRDASPVVALSDGTPASLDPGFATGAAPATVLGQVYETLFAPDPARPGFIAPLLAESVPSKTDGSVSPDGLTVTVRLRNDAKFTDGSIVDASAVKFSIDRVILMGNTASDRDILSAIRGYGAYASSDYTASDRQAYFVANGVEVVDALTVRFNLESEDPGFLSKLSRHVAGIVNPAAFKAAHPERTPFWGTAATSNGLPPPTIGDIAANTRDPWADMNTAGSSHYALTAWSPWDYIVLSRNPLHRAVDPRGPDSILIRDVADSATKIALVESGEADIAAVSPSEVDAVRTLAPTRSRLFEGPASSIGVVWWSYDVGKESACPRDGATGVADCRFFDDREMRRAWTHAFDYGLEISTVLGGRASRLASVIPAGTLGHEPSLAAHATDLEAARDALSKSRHPAGFVVDLHYPGASATRRETAELFASALEALSPAIDVDLVELSPDNLAPRIASGEVAVAFVGLTPRHPSPDAYAREFLDPRGFYGGAASYADPPMRTLLDEAVAAKDQDGAAAAWSAVARRAKSEYAYLWNIQEIEFRLVSKDFDGFGSSILDPASPIERFATVEKT